MLRSCWERLGGGWPTGGFGRNVLKIAGGTALSQALMLAFLPVLARLYSPREFGVFAVFVAVAMIAKTLAGGRYEMAVPIPKGDREAWALLRLVACLCVGFAVATSILLILWTPPRLGACGVFLHLLPWHVACFTANVALAQWLSRKGDFAWLGSIRVVYAAVVLIAQVVAALCLDGPGGLILGLVVGTATVTVLNYARALRTRPSEGTEGFSIWRVARRHHRFPAYLLPAHGVNALGAQLPVLFLTGFYGETVAGYFAMAMRVLEAPTRLVGQSISQVFYPRAARQYARQNQCVALYVKLVRRLFYVGTAALLAVLFFVPSAVVLVAGEPWQQVGYLIQILMPFFLVRFVSHAVCTVGMIAGKQKIDLAWQVAMLVLVVSGLSAGVLLHDWVLSIVGYGIAVLIAFVAALSLNYRFACGPGRLKPALNPLQRS
ncbi:MAG: oligosaccharide flippase family protein [Planctomycetota bacterium]|jgi:O-antigen/teichoic acid export membrane protein